MLAVSRKAAKPETERETSKHITPAESDKLNTQWSRWVCPYKSGMNKLTSYFFFLPLFFLSSPPSFSLSFKRSLVSKTIIIVIYIYWKLTMCQAIISSHLSPTKLQEEGPVISFILQMLRHTEFTQFVSNKWPYKNPGAVTAEYLGLAQSIMR